MRNIPLVSDEYYHVFNRGVDRRTIVEDQLDVQRFMQSIVDFNVIEPIGSIYEKNVLLRAKQAEAATVGSLASNEKASDLLVEFVAYCLNPNHFHFLLKQVADRGIEQFMQRLGTGYTKYFNLKHKRTGSLFQGTFKAIHVESDEYLLHLSAYINLNNRVHKLNEESLLLHRSSWGEYVSNIGKQMCVKDIVLERFGQIDEYKKYAEDAVQSTIDGRASDEKRGLYVE